MGVLAPGAFDLGAFWGNLSAGRSAVGPIRRFDASAFPARIAAEAAGFRAEDHVEDAASWEALGPIAAFAAAAARAAVADAGLLGGAPDPARAGVLFAAGMGSYGHREVFLPCSAGRQSTGDFDWDAFHAALRAACGPRSAERRTPGSVAAALARRFGFRGPVMSVMTACSGGTQALGDAARWIRDGRADVVLAGGADSELYPMGVASFFLLGALSTRGGDPASARRPFDAARDGLGSAKAQALVLVSGSRATPAAKIRAESLWFRFDSYRDRRIRRARRRLAMGRRSRTGISAEAVDYINAHGTSTVARRIETHAIKRVFGTRVPVSSTKSMIGHLTVAYAVEAIATVLTIENRTIPPTINQETPDAECDLDYVPNRARAADVAFALSNSFAFGGQCASLLVAAP
jgi:3-oxoacyl-[acyl-carrier-protein] synthase II